jgi:POTRA domain, FtsQ-type
MSAGRTTRAGTRRRSARRGPDIRRASAGMNRTRSLALLVLIASGLALYGLSASPAFGYRRMDIVGASSTSVSTIRSELAVDAGVNLFRLSTDGMADRLAALPTVAGASIEIQLPDTLRVRLIERQPVLVWQVGDRRLLVDATGVAFAEATDTSGLPVIDDRRVPVGLPDDRRGDDASQGPVALPPSLAVGDTIDPIDFDAATRLGSLRPADVGSGSAGLHVSIDDDHGFSVDTGTDGWSAVFGFYTPTIRKAELIPGQVRLLRSLLAGREETIATIVLADDREGTFTPKASPSAGSKAP